MTVEQAAPPKPKEITTKTAPGEVYESPKGLEEFKEMAKAAYKKGWRLMCITAIDKGENIELIYHFDTQKFFLYHIRYMVDPDVEHVSLVEYYPAAYLFENEVCELMGVKIKGIKGKIFLSKDMDGMHPLRKSFKIEEMLVKLQGPPVKQKIKKATEEDRMGMAGKTQGDLKEDEACDFDEEEVAAKLKKDKPKEKKAPPKKEEDKKDGDA
jgi:NADH:ubiquinone oxidoreductase subunit C